VDLDWAIHTIKELLVKPVKKSDLMLSAAVGAYLLRKKPEHTFAMYL
jgi:hypothetical protein